MASRGLGTLTLDLVARIAGFTGPLDKAGRDLDKRMSAMEKRATAFGKALGTALVTGATAVVTGLTAITKQAIDNADQLRDLSIRLGESTETLSAFGYAASQTGTDLDTLGRGMKILAKNAADALKPTSEQAQIFSALGISVQDAEGKLKDLGVLVPEIADKFKAMEDGTTKAALAQALFGKAGLELTEFLNSGSRGLDEFTEKARELGIIVGTDTANAADEFNDKVADLKATVAGFGNQLAAELLPELIKLVDYMQASTKEGELLGLAISDVKSAFALFTGELQKADEVGNSFRAMLAATANTVESLKSGLTSLLSLEIGGFIKKMNDARNAATSALLAGFGFTNQDAPAGSSRARNARGGSNRPESGGIAPDFAALNRALSGAGAPKTGGGRKAGGKSDSQQQAEDAAKALREAAEAQHEWHQKILDMQADLAGPAAVAVREFDRTVAELSAEYAAGKITLADYATAEDLAAQSRDKSLAAIKAQLTPAQELLATLEDEIALVGMSADEQEIWNNLKYAGADADAELRQRILETTQALQGQREVMGDQIEAMDALRNAGADFLYDWTSGSKSFKDSFLDALDQIHKRILNMIAENLMDQLFGKQGDPGGGSTGNWIGQLFGMFFGGGKASGGSVVPGKFYEVGEQNRPEMLFSGGKQYMIPGNAGNVVPIKGGGITQVNNFAVQGRIDPRTQDQIAMEVGRRASTATRRNG